MSRNWSDLHITPLKAVCACARFLRRTFGTTVVRIMHKASCVRRLRACCIRDAQSRGTESTAITWPEPWQVRAYTVHLHGKNTLYHAVSYIYGFLATSFTCRASVRQIVLENA